MRASDLLAGIPETGPERERMVLEAVENEHYVPITWSPVVLSFGPYSASLMVSSDGLRLGEPGNSVRLSASHRTAQKIATMLWSSLPTAKISDAIWSQANVKLSPLAHLSWVNDGSMGELRRMIDQSDQVDNLIIQAGGSAGQLVADVGKDWVTTGRLWQSPSKASNYGWHGSGGYSAVTSDGGSVIQPIGLAHGIDHVDYSQTVRLVYRDVEVCDSSSCWTVDIYDLIRDPELAKLISHEGKLPSMEHPGVAGPGGGPPGKPSRPPVVTGGPGSLRSVAAVAGLVLGFLSTMFLLR